ncbi:hypothetical protein HOV93_32130 [Planctomycetes bacterium FF15]|uniref:Uncharacterized protein n=1 Tax=Bremerella alba TaxID=980252 RepID=A0A7V8V6T3_9BACT|nr:hypothetical protein [Bremerella alba]
MFRGALSGSWTGVLGKKMGVNFQPTNQWQMNHCSFSLRICVPLGRFRANASRAHYLNLLWTKRQKEPYQKKKEYLHAYLPSEKPNGARGFNNPAHRLMLSLIDSPANVFAKSR